MALSFRVRLWPRRLSLAALRGGSFWAAAPLRGPFLDRGRNCRELYLRHIDTHTGGGRNEWFPCSSHDGFRGSVISGRQVGNQKKVCLGATLADDAAVPGSNTTTSCRTTLSPSRTPVYWTIILPFQHIQPAEVSRFTLSRWTLATAPFSGPRHSLWMVTLHAWRLAQDTVSWPVSGKTVVLSWEGARRSYPRAWELLILP